jgi:hypothetical protein
MGYDPNNFSMRFLHFFIITMPSMMTTSNRQTRALRSATNRPESTQNQTKNKTGTCKRKQKLSEEEWRSHVLSFYQIEKKKSVAKFLDERLITQRSVFEKRWKQSGLKELKQQNISYIDACIQYDCWLSNWRAALAKTKKSNGGKRFKVFVDSNDDADTVNVITNDGNKQSNTNSNCDKNDDLLSIETNTNCNSKIEDNNILEASDESDESNAEEVNLDDNSEGDGSGERNTEKKLSHDMMKTLLAEIFTRDDSIYKVLKREDMVQNKNSVYRHWNKSGLQQMKDDGENLTLAMGKYDRWYSNQKRIIDAKNRKNGKIVKAIPEGLEIFMTELIKQLALCGQGIGKKVVTKVIEEAMREWGMTFSSSTLNRYVSNYDLECRVLKNIDPARIAQVTPANRDAFFFRLNQVVALLHDSDPIHCPWTDWKSVDSKFIDNVDEMGSDCTQHRDVLLIPKTVTQRLFQSTPEGDRANRHVSVVVFSKSNGWYKDAAAGINGAPPPMIIHSKPSKDKGASNAMEKRMQLYHASVDDEFLSDQSYFEGISEGNPLGVTIRTSTNGSMTKELFLDMACHYVRHLGPDQGSHGMYTFLLTDSHVSRWHPKALYILMKNRIIPLFFPSHLSIVVQPQDNGVILFLHKCIEDTAIMERLFRSSTDVAYINKVLETAFILFRDTERKKLMDRGSNSTTRSYRATGMKPCNPFSIGWRENLELYASYNGLRMESEQPRYYGVRPKNRSICPGFSEVDISMLNQAVPILAKDSDDDVSILNDPKTKCYAIANEIIANWVEKSYDERAIRPRAITAVEKLALKHMDIIHIVTSVPVTEDALLLLDLHNNEKKRQAILGQTKANEGIQVRPKDSEERLLWSTAIKMQKPDNMWHLFDGIESKQISTQELEKDYEINLAFDMFPTDKRLRETRSRASRRRRDEKYHILKTMAESIAEEERNGELKESFDQFMRQPKDDQTFTEFKKLIVKKIEEPSEHAVEVSFGSEEHTMKVCAHGNNLSSMSCLVMENICKTLVCVATRSERKSSNSGRRRGGKVVSVKRGSDGFQKVLQIDEQHQNDSLRRVEDDERSKKAMKSLCKIRLRELRKICLLGAYKSIWKTDNKVLIANSKHLTKRSLISFLQVFNVDGRTKLSKESRILIETKLDEFNITQFSFEKMENDLLEELQLLGGEDNFQVDQSFDASIHYDSEESTDGENDHAISVLLESETSCGSKGNNDNDSTSSSSSDDASRNGTSNDRRMVSFDEQPTIYNIPRNSPPQLRRRQQKSKPETTTRKTTASTTATRTRRNPSRVRAPPKKYIDN